MSDEKADGTSEESPPTEIKEDSLRQEEEKPGEDGVNISAEAGGSSAEVRPDTAEGEGGGGEGGTEEGIGSTAVSGEEKAEGDGGGGGREGDDEVTTEAKAEEEEETVAETGQHHAEDEPEGKFLEVAEKSHEDYLTTATTEESAASQYTLEEYSLASEATNEFEDRPVGVPSDSALGPSPSSPTQPGVVPILDDIREEEEEEEEESEEVRQELITKILEAAAERDRMQTLSSQVQSDIAEYLARKKDEEKADPGRTVIDHEKKYYQCMTSLEHLHEEIKQVKQKTAKETEELIALKDSKLEEVEKAKMEFVKYRREKVLNVVDQRTGRKLTAKELEHYQALEDKKEKDIVQIRLECIKLQNKIAKIEASIKQKEQLVGGLHLIDFEQLKINNVDLNEKIEERNDDILKLKKKVTSTVEVLTHVKEKLQFLQTENAEKKEALREIEAVVAKKRDHLTRIKRARDSLRADNMRLCQKGGLVGHTSLLRDFEERMDQSKAMYERLEFLQKRQAELTVMCDGLKRKIEQAKYVSTSRV